MGRFFSLIKKKQDTIFCVAVVSLLILICIPLFVIARYNYMSVDDYGYGAAAHQAIQNGQPWKIFGLAAKQAADVYRTWQGSFSAVFLFGLQPGIWGERYYQLGIYIIISCLMLTQFLLIKRIAGAGPAKVGRKCLIGICALLYLIQIFYMPYPEECFYWLNGSLYYTFFYTLQLLLFSETLVVFRFPARLKGKQWLFLGWMIFLAVALGGSNLATGLSTALVFALLTVALFARKQTHRFHILLVAVVYLIAFAVNMAAPGNAVRAQDPGYHLNSPVMTVLVTIQHSMMLVYGWTDIKMYLVLLMAAPFLWQIAGAITENWKFTFQMPIIATVFLFGTYASQMAPITHVSSTFGPRRMSDMIWCSYLLWMFSVEGYWLGWFRHRYGEHKRFISIRSLLLGRVGMIQIGCLALWCVLVLVTTVKFSSTYRASAALWTGKAQRYAEENEKRLKILHDPNIKDVYFHKIECEADLIYNVDISADNQDNANVSMAQFYNKNSVNLIQE